MVYFMENPNEMDDLGIPLFLETPTCWMYIIPIGSMYGIFTYIWLIFMVDVGKYTIDTLIPWILWDINIYFVT